MNNTKEREIDTLKQECSEYSKINACILCGSKDLTIKPARFIPFIVERMFISKHKSTFAVHCNSCHLNYSSYRPNEEEMTRLYSGYRDESYQKQRQKYDPSYTKEYNYNLGHNPMSIVSRRNFLNKVANKYLCTNRIQKVLDYGGDNGQFIPECFSNAEKFVYEVSNVPTINGVKNISRDEILSNPNFDFVMCCHVLEHVANPIGIIKELISFCKNDGYVYIEVPYEPEYINNKYIHEHIAAYSEETFLKLWDIFDNIEIIDARTYLKRTYVLIKKHNVNKIKKLLKKIIQNLNIQKQKCLRTFFDIKEKFNILYQLSR